MKVQNISIILACSTLHFLLQYLTFSPAVPYIFSCGTLHFLLRYLSFSPAVPYSFSCGTLQFLLQYLTFSPAVPYIFSCSTLHLLVLLKRYQDGFKMESETRCSVCCAHCDRTVWYR